MDIKNLPGLLLSVAGWAVLVVGVAHLAASASVKFNTGWAGLAVVLVAFYSILRLLHYIDEKSKECTGKMDAAYRRGYLAGKDGL